MRKLILTSVATVTGGAVVSCSGCFRNRSISTVTALLMGVGVGVGVGDPPPRK